jgi:hypothetical protein
MSTEERDFLDAKAKELGLRDMVSVIRWCLRKGLGLEAKTE